MHESYEVKNAYKLSINTGKVPPFSSVPVEIIVHPLPHVEEKGFLCTRAPQKYSKSYVALLQIETDDGETINLSLECE